MAPLAPLAIDQNGELFELPEDATAWRVRRFSKSGKGAPEPVFRDGARLTIPINADADELHEALRHCIDDDLGGKYRLDPIDEDGRSVGGGGAYVLFGSSEGGGGRAPQASDNGALTKALECNFRLVNSVVDALKVISTQYAAAMESSAKAASLRARNLPDIDPTALVPIADAATALAATAADDEETTRHTVDWTPIVEQCAPIVSQLGALAAAKIGSKMMGTPPAPPRPEGK